MRIVSDIQHIGVSTRHHHLFKILQVKLLKVLQVLALESNLLAVSSKEGEGMDDLYSLVQSTFAGGDDLEAHTDAN